MEEEGISASYFTGIDSGHDTKYCDNKCRNTWYRDKIIILNLHALLSNNLLPDPAAPGRLREFSVGITNSVFTPLAIPQLISEFFDLILKKANLIENPFEQAFFVSVHLPYLQPFDDVNKRGFTLSGKYSAEPS